MQQNYFVYHCKRAINYTNSRFSPAFFKIYITMHVSLQEIEYLVPPFTVVSVFLYQFVILLLLSLVKNGSLLGLTLKEFPFFPLFYLYQEKNIFISIWKCSVTNEPSFDLMWLTLWDRTLSTKTKEMENDFYAKISFKPFLLSSLAYQLLKALNVIRGMRWKLGYAD